jgi:hypothetical protein
MSADRGTKAWRSLVAFEAAVGGRAALAEILSFAKAPNARQQAFILLLSDADRDRDSLNALCAQAGITGADVLMLLNDAGQVQAFVQAQQKYFDKLPEVAETIARNATDHLAPCECTYDPAVRSTGKGHPECKACKGRGVLFYKADLDAAKLVLESSGMLKKGDGLVINNTVENKTLAIADGSLFDRFVKATDAVAMLPAAKPQSLPAVTVIDADTEPA